MRKATRIVAATFGVLAGLAGLEHGYFEFLQGSAHPASWMFPSMGPPCAPEIVWNACEPAMTILPNLQIAGILTVLLGLMIIAWSIGFVQRKFGGVMLILLSFAMLLCGGGFFPPLIGITGGAAGIWINKPLKGAPGKITRFSARLWPWPLVVLVAWLLGQFPLGAFYNDFLKSIIGFGLLLILVLLPFSVFTAYAHDAVTEGENRI
jgi:hypothetical protein